MRGIRSRNSPTTISSSAIATPCCGAIPRSMASKPGIPKTPATALLLRQSATTCASSRPFSAWPAKKRALTAARHLINYGFRFFETRLLYKAGEEVTSARIWKSANETSRLGVLDDLYITVRRGAYDQLVSTLDIPAVIEAPIAAGQPVARLAISLGDEQLLEHAAACARRQPAGVPVAAHARQHQPALRVAHGEESATAVSLRLSDQDDGSGHDGVQAAGSRR